MQGGLINYWPHQHRNTLRALRQREILEPLCPVRVKMPLHTDLISHSCSVSITLSQMPCCNYFVSIDLCTHSCDQCSRLRCCGGIGTKQGDAHDHHPQEPENAADEARF